MEPAAIIYSPDGYRSVLMDPGTFAHLLNLDQRLEERPFMGCRQIIDQKSSRPFRVVTARILAEREAAEAHKKIIS